MSNVLAHLCQLADTAKVAKHPVFGYATKSAYGDKDANGSTRCIVLYKERGNRLTFRRAELLEQGNRVQKGGLGP